MKLDLNLLLVLDAMLRERSVTAVAEQLQTSQPTVSFSLKKLRKVLDDELFVRTGQGMEPTPKALALTVPVRQMLQILESEILEPQSFDPENSHRTFTVNTTDIGEMVFLPPLLRRLHDYAPNASVQCVCLPPRELAQELAQGNVDLAIGYQPELGGNSIYVQGLFEHPFVCIVRQDHPGIRKKMSLKHYTKAEHIALTGEGHNQKQFEKIIRKSVKKRRITFRSQHFMNIPFIVRETDLVATVPKVIAVAYAHLPGLRVLPPPVPVPPIPIKQYWHQKLNKDPAQIWLRRCISDLFLDKDPTKDFKIPG